MWYQHSLISLYLIVTTKGHCAITGFKQYLTTVAILINHLYLGYFHHTVPFLERDSFQLNRSKYIPDVESCEPQKQSCDLTAQKFKKLINFI
jgi:hypothetical protein